MLTRSDGVPTSPYGETRYGLEFQSTGLAAFNNVGSLKIGQRMDDLFIPLARSQPDKLASWKNGTFDFTITDDGNAVSFEMTEVGNPANSLSISAVDPTVYPGNLVTFHNRERYLSTKKAFLDDVRIESLTLSESGPPTVVVLGNSGWQASWDSSLDPFVDISVDAVTDDAVFVQTTAEFAQRNGPTGFPAVPVTFRQIEADAVERIVINDEIITNSTGSDWTGFGFELLDGDDAAFNPELTGASAGGSGFYPSPFDTQTFDGDERTFSVDGLGLGSGGGNAVIADGSHWFPGNGASDGELYIDVITGDGTLGDPFTVFTLTQTPSLVSEPPAAVLAVIATLGFLALSRTSLRAKSNYSGDNSRLSKARHMASVRTKQARPTIAIHFAVDQCYLTRPIASCRTFLWSMSATNCSLALACSRRCTECCLLAC